MKDLDRRNFLCHSVSVAAGAAAGLHMAGTGLSSQRTYDVVVYGGTSAGVAAAVQAARMRRSVVLIEPGRQIGGMTSGGISIFEVGEGLMLEPGKRALGGIAKEFTHRVYLHYAEDDAWVYQERHEYRDGAKDWNENKAWWMFEPHVAETIFNDMICEAKVLVLCHQRLDLDRGVQKEGSRIVAIKMESGRTFHGKVFVDATYEGDLMAKAGVSYTVGREPNSQYSETLNGVQTRRQAERNYRRHHFMRAVDPYVKPGDPSSGLLPSVHTAGPGKEGDGDHRVQAYCFRPCLTDELENSVPFTKPKNYNPLRYELLFRYYEAGYEDVPWNFSPNHQPTKPNRKQDLNNRGPFSADNIGMNYDYPDGDYAIRRRIIRDHVDYQKGLMWTVANHPRIPQKIRKEVSRWGLAKDEFVDNDNWPQQIYVREARRMKSAYVMTENNCLGQRIAPDSIGLGTFPMDSHNTQRYVDKQGRVRNEGNVQTVGNTFPPYPISYRSITPKAHECSNLLVPVCLSASHIAFGSLRLEPTYMLLGQSAATAAVHAIEEGTDVQAINYPRLRTRLCADKQVLKWVPTAG